MRSSGHVAAMMSGGLDSASIAAMAKRLLPEMPGKEFHTYSAISDHPETCVESQCIQKLTADLGDKAHFVSVPSFAGMVNVEDLIDVGWSKAHPVDNSILLPAMMCLAASRNGHRVMLHGMAGDLATYVPIRYIAYLMLAGQWRQAWEECRNASRNFTYLRGTSPVVIWLLNIWTACAPGDLKLCLRRLRERGAGGPLAGSLIDRGFAGRLMLVERMREKERRMVRSSTGVQPTHIRALWTPPGIPGGLEGYDRVAGRYGVELRDPWADKRVVEFFLRLPLRYKVREGWTKYLVRTGFAPDLAPQIRWRTGKEHLGWHFICRLMDETHGFVSQNMGESFEVAGRYTDIKAVRARYAGYCTSKGSDERQDLHDTMTLMLWTRRLFRLNMHLIANSSSLGRT
jgi:asparagine synthase (glutamine-hydrolysing)